MRPMENVGFPMLSSAAVNAFMCVISRVIRNCSASIVPGSSVEFDQPFVDDLGASLRRNIAAQIDIQFAGDLQVIGRPGVAHGVTQAHSAAARNRDQRVGLRRVPVVFHGLQMHSGQRADDLQMAQFFGTDIHQQVFAFRVVAVQALDRILHGRGEFAIAPPNCSSSILPNRGSGCPMRTVYISFFMW